MHLNHHVNIFFQLAAKFVEFIAIRNYQEAEKIHQQLLKAYNEALEDKIAIGSMQEEIALSMLRQNGPLDAKQMLKEKVFSAVLSQIYVLIFWSGPTVGINVDISKDLRKALEDGDLNCITKIMNGLHAFIENLNASPNKYFFMLGIVLTVKDFLNLPENISRLILWNLIGQDKVRSYIYLQLFTNNTDGKIEWFQYLCKQGFDLVKCLDPNDISLSPKRFEDWYNACCAIGFEFDETRKAAVMKFIILKINSVFNSTNFSLVAGYNQWREQLREIMQEWGIPVFSKQNPLELKLGLKTTLEKEIDDSRKQHVLKYQDSLKKAETGLNDSLIALTAEYAVDTVNIEHTTAIRFIV